MNFNHASNTNNSSSYNLRQSVRIVRPQYYQNDPENEIIDITGANGDENINNNDNVGDFVDMTNEPDDYSDSSSVSNASTVSRLVGIESDDDDNVDSDDSDDSDNTTGTLLDEDVNPRVHYNVEAGIFENDIPMDYSEGDNNANEVHLLPQPIDVTNAVMQTPVVNKGSNTEPGDATWSNARRRLSTMDSPEFHGFVRNYLTAIPNYFDMHGEDMMDQKAEDIMLHGDNMFNDNIMHDFQLHYTRTNAYYNNNNNSSSNSSNSNNSSSNNNNY